MVPLKLTMPVFTVSPMVKFPMSVKFPEKMASPPATVANVPLPAWMSTALALENPLAANNSPPLKISPTLTLPRLVSLATLAVMYGYFTERRYILRLILVLAAVPIAVAANGLRIMGTGILGEYWSPDMAEGFFHTFSGWIIFLLSLAMLVLLHRACNTVGRWSASKSEAL